MNPHPHTDDLTGPRLGKTDTTDAQAAGRAALNGEATARPKTADGLVEGIRMLRVVRRSAIKARTQAINQLHALVVTAPEQVKHQLRGLSTKARIGACAGFRPGTADTTTTVAKKTLRYLARRCQALTTEIKELDKEITCLCSGPTRRCSPPRVSVLTRPRLCWSQLVTTPNA